MGLLLAADEASTKQDEGERERGVDQQINLKLPALSKRTFSDSTKPGVNGEVKAQPTIIKTLPRMCQLNIPTSVYFESSVLAVLYVGDRGKDKDFRVNLAASKS